MKYKVIFLDIDGTILKRDHTYTDKTKEAIQEAQRQGLEVFLATGRPIHEIHGLAKELNIQSMIGYNGAFATYRGETIVHEVMPEKTVRYFYDLSQEHGHEFIMFTDEKNYFSDLESPVLEHFGRTFQMTINAAFRPDILPRVLGLTVMGVLPEQVPLYEKENSVHLSKVRGTGIEHTYDIIRDKVNKGEAIKKILEHLNIPKEAAIAFGDGMNDKEMLQAVGEGFAMGNANPDLLPYAKHQTATVDESGIYIGLQQLGIVE